jgi:hypothetical protein
VTLDPRLKRTKFAAHAATLAEQFEAALSGRAVGAHRLEMTAPEGSTGGGVQVLQHIRLVPGEGAPPGLKSYVVGNANRTTSTAELRSLEYVDEVSFQRFRERTGFDAAQYRECMAEAARFLSAWGMTVTQLIAAPASEQPVPRKRAGLSRTALVVIIVWTVAVLAIGLVVGVMTTRGH